MEKCSCLYCIRVCAYKCLLAALHTCLLMFWCVHKSSCMYCMCVCVYICVCSFNFCRAYPSEDSGLLTTSKVTASTCCIHTKPYCSVHTLTGKHTSVQLGVILCACVHMYPCMVQQYSPLLQLNLCILL